jgi:hypothetical protein
MKKMDNAIKGWRTCQKSIWLNSPLLFPIAPMVPATCVPCELSDLSIDHSVEAVMGRDVPHVMFRFHPVTLVGRSG